MGQVEDEDQWMEHEMHVVPPVDPDDKCNGKKKLKRNGEVVRNDDGHVLFGGYCNNPAGKGTDHFGDGRCKHHGGSIKEGDVGAPAHNQNAQKSATSADPHHYHQNLPLEEKEFIEDVTATILDRIRRLHGREPDFLDKVLARRVSIELHIVSQASDYTKDELVQVIIQDGSSHETPGALVEEVRRYSNGIFSKLKQLGVLDDPQSQAVDEAQEWRRFLQSDSKQSQTQ